MVCPGAPVKKQKSRSRIFNDNGEVRDDREEEEEEEEIVSGEERGWMARLFQPKRLFLGNHDDDTEIAVAVHERNGQENNTSRPVDTVSSPPPRSPHQQHPIGEEQCESPQRQQHDLAQQQHTFLPTATRLAIVLCTSSLSASTDTTILPSTPRSYFVDNLIRFKHFIRSYLYNLKTKLDKKKKKKRSCICIE